MKWTKRLSILSFFLLLFLFNACEDTLKYVNFEQFDNTKAEKLADAVRNEDIEEIERIVKIDKVPVDFQEPEIGNTVLMVAVIAQKRKSIEKLLELGANPNLTNKKWCESAFQLACERFLDGKCDIEQIDLLIKFGADVNFPQTYKHRNGTYFQTPLMISVDMNLDVTKKPNDKLFYYLIKKGANINKFGPDSTCCVLATVLDYDRLDLLKYLIINKKAHIPEYIFIVYRGLKDEKKQTIIECLKSRKFDKGSENYRLKKEIILLLKQKGYK